VPKLENNAKIGRRSKKLIRGKVSAPGKKVC